ncbi:MAG: DNA topoisomerase 4 subunit A, partial [Clostridia bacterium]|nr:DNA topoisomerase 4 subunit A [Clostridia bacterium]
MSENKQPIFEVSLDEVLHNSMMPYAEHVILDRALPRVEDGLKPVQRRILYTMYELGLTPDKPHKKCAKIVGDCLGKYHPHGDSSVYDALVRMAQDFNMRMPLVNGHGNFGTVDGDTAAAYRYTEARLEQLALELLRDIDKDTVDFSLNFDDSLMEPNTLPGRFPNLLVNGATGIAVGLATNIPPHNLGEVIDGTIAMIDNPKISLKEMMKHIKGPDFPTGAQIVGGEELENAYATGRGKIRVRANISLETDGAKRSIVIKEIPYQVNKANLLKKIADLKEDKKEEAFADIAEVVDESDRTGMRAVVRLKKDADANKICALLLKYTDLETTFGINMVAIAGGKPKQMGLLEILSYYINYQREVILRRSKYDLERAKERAHILEGLIIAVLNIDEVVRIIKNSANTPEARQNLRARFQLSEIQANAVLDLRLARLTRLEITKLQEELEQLRRLIKELTAIIGSKKLQMEVVKTELTEIKKKYKNARRTGIGGAAEVAIEETAAEEKAVRNLVAVFTADRTFKLVPEKNYNLSDRSVEGGGAGDILTLSVPVRSDQMLLAFSNLGNAFKIDPEIVQAAKLRDKGQKFTDVAKDAQQNEYPVAFYPLEEEIP